MEKCFSAKLLEQEIQRVFLYFNIGMSKIVLLKKYNEINQRFITKFFRRTFYMQKRQVFYMMEDDKFDLLL